MRLLFAIMAVCFSTLAFAQQPSFKEGVDYVELPQALATKNPDKIEVIEVFAYSCPHCYRFETEVSANWALKKAEDVDFIELPSAFNGMQEIHARLFYTVKALGKLDTLHRPIFEAIHLDKKRLDRVPNIKAFMVSKGVDGAKFDKYYSNFGVKNQVKKAKSLVAAYGITGTPQLVVGGRYRVSATNKTLQVVDFLVNKIRAERKLQSS